MSTQRVLPELVETTFDGRDAAVVFVWPSGGPLAIA